MKYTISKPDFRDKKNYSKIPNGIFPITDLTTHQKYTLMYLMTHKDGFRLNIQFIQKGLNLSNWITVRDHLFILNKKNYITIDGDKIKINLDTVATNSMSTNSNTTKTISTNSVTTATNSMSTENTNPVSSTS